MAAAGARSAAAAHTAASRPGSAWWRCAAALRAIAPLCLLHAGVSAGCGPCQTAGPTSPAAQPAWLAALKKEKESERLPVTQALWAALAHAEACELGGLFNEEELLQRSLSALHALLCAPLDRNCSATLRTHNEQLRCFEVLGQLYPEDGGEARQYKRIDEFAFSSLAASRHAFTTPSATPAPPPEARRVAA